MSQLPSWEVFALLGFWDAGRNKWKRSVISVHTAYHSWNNILNALAHSVNSPEEGFFCNERDSALKHNHSHSELLELSCCTATIQTSSHPHLSTAMSCQLLPLPPGVFSPELPDTPKIWVFDDLGSCWIDGTNLLCSLSGNSSKELYQNSLILQNMGTWLV